MILLAGRHGEWWVRWRGGPAPSSRVWGPWGSRGTRAGGGQGAAGLRLAAAVAVLARAAGADVGAGITEHTSLTQKLSIGAQLVGGLRPRRDH